MRRLEIVNKAYDFFMQNREMLALKNNMDYACNQEEINLILGSSYARNAVDLYSFQHNVVNCSVSSMDLYWSNKIYNKIKSKQTKVKTVILFIGYYALYMELEKQTDPANDAIREKILKPIVCKDIDCLCADNNLDDKQEIFEIASEMQKNRGGVFSDLYCRKSRLGLAKPWCDYSVDEREKMGMERAKCHNRFQKYQESFAANCKIIKQIKNDCAINKSNLLFIIPPFSKEYNKGISVSMKKELLAFLKEIDVNYIDFNEMNIWLDADFVDADHVSGCGAVKFSMCLNDMILNNR